MNFWVVDDRTAVVIAVFRTFIGGSVADEDDDDDDDDEEPPVTEAARLGMSCSLADSLSC